MYRSRYNSSGRNEIETTFQRFNRPSLSSIQIRVLARLCDRPPKYESQTNYAHRLQRDEQQQSHSSPTITGEIPFPPVIGNQPPPAYDGERNTVSSEDLQYSAKERVQ